MTDFAKLILGADTSGLKTAMKDLDGLSKGADKAEKSTIGFNKGLVALGVAATAAATALVMGVKSAINTADEYAKMSQRLGIAVKELGALAYAADLSGVSFQSLATGVQFLARNMAEFQKGTATAVDAFNAVNVKVADSEGNLRNTNEVLEELADRFAAMPDGAQKTALAMELVGRGGGQLIPLLNGGSESLREMREEAEALGLVMSEETAKQAEVFNDNLTRIGSGLKGVFNIIAAAVLPALVSLSNTLVDATKAAVGFFRTIVEMTPYFGGVLKGVLTDAVTWIDQFIAGGVASMVGLWEALKAAVTGGDVVAAFTDQFKNIEFNANNTLAAIAAFNGALTSLDNKEKENTGTVVQLNVALGASAKSFEFVRKHIDGVNLSAAKLNKSFYDVVKSLKDQINNIGKSAREMAIWNAQAALGVGATDKMSDAVARLAGELFDAEDQERRFVEALEKLPEHTRSIGEQMWDGFKSTFFAPFEEGAEGMADKFAQQVDRMSQAAARMASSGGLLGKLQGGLDVLSNIPGIGSFAGVASMAISTAKSIVGIVKSIGGALFGGSYQTTGGGLQLQLGASGVVGQNFEEQFKKGGLFSSSKTRTLFSGVTGDQSAQFAAAYNAILDNATTAFGLFGIEASRDIMQQVRIAALNIKTSGEGALSEAAAKEAVAAWFAQLDAAVVGAVGGEGVQALLDLKQDGEAATETLIRLGNQLNAVNTLLAAVDVTMYDIGVNGAMMANALVEFAGGMDALQSGVNSFFQNFFTEQEQFEKLSERLASVFADLNLTLPDTRAGVRDLVNSLDLTTEAGQKAFAAIMTNADALSAYFTAMEEAAPQIATMANLMNKSTDAALSMLTQSINAEKTLKQSAYDESIALIQNESRIRIESANLALGAARQNLNSLRGEVGSIMSALTGAQSNFDPMGSRNRAVSLLQSALQTGNLSGAGAAAQQAARLDAGNFTSAAAFRREQARTLNLLGELSEKGQDQVNYAELTVRAIEDEIVAIQASTAELIDVETILFEQQIAVLDDQLARAEEQLNVLRGIDTGILSVENALRDFYSAISAERANGGVPPGVTVDSVAGDESTSDKIAMTLEEIKTYSQQTATTNTKMYNLENRVWRESQAEETV